MSIGLIMPVMLALLESAAVTTSDPVMLVPQAGDARLRSDLTRPPQQPTLSRELLRTGAVFWGEYNICVDLSGIVSRVSVVRGAAPLTPTSPPAATPEQLARLDEIWMTAIRSWRYEPHRLQGKVVPFCYVRRLQNRPSTRMLAPDVGARLLQTDITQDPNASGRPSDGSSLPAWGVYQICVQPDGTVYQVKVIKSASASLDGRWVEQMKRWRYRPYVAEGQGAPSPFCYPHSLSVDR